MGMSSQEQIEWEESGFIVKDPENFDQAVYDQKNCFDYAFEKLAKDFQGWNINKTQYSLAQKKNSLTYQGQMALLDQADKKAGVSKLSLMISENHDFQSMKQAFGKVISTLMLDQQHDFDDEFRIVFQGRNSEGGHIHVLDLPSLLLGKQNFNPHFAFQDLNKMEDIFAKYDELFMDIRTKNDFNNPQVAEKIARLVLNFKPSDKSVQDILLDYKNNFKSA